MSENTGPETGLAGKAANLGCLLGLWRRLAKNGAMILVIVIVGLFLFSLARSAIYKIRPYERGLHLRGGRYIGLDEPGWHFKIPYVDTVIGVMVIERPGVIEKLAAMTADDVTMDIALLYTYRVLDPVRYQLEVLQPDKIVAGFVEGTLRDVVNTKAMDEVMHSRAEINREVITALREREDQYGVEFVTVQIQSASPPVEVVSAIKDRMVAAQLEEKATADARQQRTLADSEFYTVQKQADGEAYQITKLAEAEATRITLTAEAQKEALRAVLQELEGQGTLGEEYIQVLIAQELRQNSKWVISNGGAMPVIDITGTTSGAEAPSAP